VVQDESARTEKDETRLKRLILKREGYFINGGSVVKGNPTI
jgi:hypothetical protein